jgi:hypothetical protein
MSWPALRGLLGRDPQGILPDIVLLHCTTSSREIDRPVRRKKLNVH